MPLCLLALWQFLLKFIASFMLQLLNRSDQWPLILYYGNRDLLFISLWLPYRIIFHDVYH